MMIGDKILLVEPEHKSRKKKLNSAQREFTRERDIFSSSDPIGLEKALALHKDFATSLRMRYDGISSLEPEYATGMMLFGN